MSGSLSRRKFINGVTTAGAGLYLGLSPSSATRNGLIIPPENEPLLDWSSWEQFRSTVKHPCLTIKPSDLECARENIRRYEWAKDYTTKVERNAERYLQLMTPAFLEKMIEETTPGHQRMTPCPACRDQGKPIHLHGIWTWNISDPFQIKCDICGTVFPNTKYPEDIVLHTTWGRPQTITYYSGDPFIISGYKRRPSFSANIRARKVQWMANYSRILADAYALSGKPEYANTCRTILLRLADCYPYWLVHVGSGEYADMDPRVASMNITNLPYPELCPPPNIPDKKLLTGYWSAGRTCGSGLESDFVRKTVESYDLTCCAYNLAGNPIYSENEKLKIEHDLLLESTILLVCDKQINNKSVSNHTAAALVGMCVGHPGLVRFGLEGFTKALDSLYFTDGTSCESPFYGLMTLGGIWDMAQAIRDYSDPPGYKDSGGFRIDKPDLYQNNNYHLVWDAFYKGLQGDFHYPTYADSFLSTKLDVAYVELMVANYPDQIEYLSLLKTLCGNDLSLHSGSSKFSNRIPGNAADDEPVLDLPYDLAVPDRFSSFSLYYRNPGQEKQAAPALKLPDWCPPVLSIGHMRTGDDGLESLLLLNASQGGVHHDSDSLNLYYWKNGTEILSDLGYLWDHPFKSQNKRTVAHNTVLIDEKNQVGKERGGDVLFFKTFENVKVMEMSSSAYPEAKLYRRTSAIISHGNGKNYVVDFFRVEGGKQQDYVFHGVENACKLYDIDLQPSSVKLYDFSNIRSASGDGVWRTTWQSGENNCVAWSAGQKGEQVMVADGWGQRDWKNSDIGAKIPYIVRRCKGEGVKTFISVFEGYAGANPFVRNVKLIDPSGIILIETELGRDYVMSMAETGILKLGSGKNGKSLTGHFAAGSVQNKKLIWSLNVQGNKDK